jgi:hypothetical protein
MRYIKKQVEVEAIQLKAGNFDKVKKFMDKEDQHIEYYNNEVDFVKRENPRGIRITRDRVLRIGDYLVKEADDNFYAMTKELFDKTHQAYVPFSEQESENTKQLSLFEDIKQLSLF